MIYVYFGILVLLGPALDMLFHRAPAMPNGGYGSTQSQHYLLQPEFLRLTKCKRIDYLLVPLLFTSLYSRLALLAILCKSLSHPVVWIGGAVLAAATMRGLQEISHYALHGSLLPNRQWALTFADVCSQAILMRPSIQRRFRTHILLHHPNVNDEAVDPNVQEFIKLGFRPPMSSRRFWTMILYPLTLRGIYGTFCDRLDVIRNSNPVRLLAPAVLISVLFILGGVASVLVAYVIPLLILYPFFAWLSQLIEHRWFAPSVHSRPTGEYASGRALVSNTALDIIAMRLILPFGDAYHLAHSLYPSVRWNYLSKVHSILLRSDKEYAACRNDGLIFSSHRGTSVFADLKLSMVETTDNVYNEVTP